MATLSSLFDLSRNALAADQAALTATADNVSNQNTAGYTRQVVSFQSGASLTLSDGAISRDGSPTVSASSQRDRVLEQRVQQQTQAQAGAASRAGVLSSVEDVFSLSGSTASAGSTEIGTALDSFFDSLTALASNPSDSVTRTSVLSAASTLATAFNTANTQLTGVQTSINGELTSSVSAVNALTASIAKLNKEIGENSPDADAGTLEDQRQLAISQLSQYVGLNQIQTEANGITLTTQGGAVLVAGGISSNLSSVNVGGQTEIRDSQGTDISAGVTDGSIGGQLVAQNQDLGGYRNALDALAYRVATAVNTQNAAGTDAAGNPGGAIFALTQSAQGAAGAIAVSAGSGSALASSAPGEGSLGNTNANALAAVASVTDASDQTISGQLGSLIGTIGAQSSALQQQSTDQSASLTQLTTQRDSLSGVSLDTEASNLTQYQRSYEAAAKLFSVLDSLLTDSINLGEQTTYS